MKCPQCQQDNPSHAKFCLGCGGPFTERHGSSPAPSYTDMQRALREALEQQSATSAILRAMSASTTDLQPVFDAIAESAARLCDGLFGALFRFDGKLLHVGALYGFSEIGVEATRQLFPMPPNRGTLAARALLDRAVVHVPDVTNDSEFRHRSLASTAGWRSLLAVPMLRGGEAIGTIGVAKTEVGPFTEAQIQLLQTFADQAVIAIENVRLFKELETKNARLTEALNRETATAEILKVISGSPNDVQPVLDAVAESTARLCAANDVLIHRVEDGMMRLVAHFGTVPYLAESATRAISPQAHSGRAILESRLIHDHDMLAPRSQADYPDVVNLGRLSGTRTVLAVPLLREGVPIGVIVIRRREVRPFSDEQIDLVTTFADQAVIAIENVRLFTELQTSNRDLTTALDKQTATSDILRVISRSQTDVQPVFDAILTSAVHLLGTYAGVLTRLEGDQIVLAALTSTDEAGDAAMRASYPHSLQSERAHAQAIRDRAPLNIADAHTDPRVPEAQHAIARARGYRSLVVVPLLHHDEAVGAIALTRRAPGGFTDDEIALLKTFADQAVIAIENVRLFKELQEKNRALTESLEQQTATADILQVISRSPTDVEPVFEAVVANAAHLCEAHDVAMLLVDGDDLRLVAGVGPLYTSIPADFRIGLSRGSAATRAVVDRTTVHIHDFAAESEEEYPVGRELARRFGHRSMLAVPLLREGIPIGVICAFRLEVRPFPDQQITLLQTFADQAVIAIENVRLFKELEARNRDLSESLEQQTATADILRAISGSPIDIQPVFDTIARSAVMLCHAFACRVFRADGELFHVVGEAYERPETRALFYGTHPEPIGSDGPSATAARERRVVQYADVPNDPRVPPRYRERARARGYRALMCVPMMRDQTAIGTIAVARQEPVLFSEQQVELIKTFADQAVIAIENVRLFKELEASNQEIAEKSRQIEVASQHKSEFLANMSHELRTPLNAVIGFSEVLSERMFGDLNEKQDEYLKDIHASGQHLLSLINDILDLSKIEAGRMELELTDFYLPAALDNALTLVRERAGRHGIALHAAIDHRIEYIRADERKIKQVLLNLLSNAIKFTPDGGRIDLRAAPAVGVIQVSVTDTGVGIAPEDQEAIFEEFRQVGTAAKKVEGTGLGLALSRKFIELHGGKIWVKSEMGAGSTFTFTIPVRHGD